VRPSGPRSHRPSLPRKEPPLRYLLVASGFQGVDLQVRSPCAEVEKLQALAPADLGDTTALRDAVETLNANAARLNSLLFTHMDYAATGRRA
jgi:hypothetical protein